MQCNIDQRGRSVRSIWGWLMLAVAVAVTAAGLAGWIIGWWVWVVVAIAAGSGVLGLWESRKGYCVVRGMGFKTPV
jgi:hypothetical protein